MDYAKYTSRESDYAEKYLKLKCLTDNLSRLALDFNSKGVVYMHV